MRLRIGKTTIRGSEVGGALLVGGAAAQGGEAAMELSRQSAGKPTAKPGPYDDILSGQQPAGPYDDILNSDKSKP
jgi:hypothetical protein